MLSSGLNLWDWGRRISSCYSPCPILRTSPLHISFHLTKLIHLYIHIYSYRASFGPLNGIIIAKPHWMHAQFGMKIEKKIIFGPDLLVPCVSFRFIVQVFSAYGYTLRPSHTPSSTATGFETTFIPTTVSIYKMLLCNKNRFSITIFLNPPPLPTFSQPNKLLHFKTTV